MDFDLIEKLDDKGLNEFYENIIEGNDNGLQIATCFCTDGQRTVGFGDWLYEGCFFIDIKHLYTQQECFAWCRSNVGYYAGFFPTCFCEHEAYYVYKDRVDKSSYRLNSGFGGLFGFNGLCPDTHS